MRFVVLVAAAYSALLAPVDSKITPGTITVVAGGDRKAAQDVTKIFVDAVEHAVLQTRFLPLPNPSHSRYIATVEVTQTPKGVVASGDSRSAAKPNMAYSGGVLSLSLPSSKARIHGLILTRLTVNVSLRGDYKVVWTGQAVTIRVSTARDGQLSVVAAALSNAVLARFPVQLSGPISVP